MKIASIDGGATTLASPTQESRPGGAGDDAFGIGTALPLTVIGSVSHRLFANSKANLLRAGTCGKYVLGGLMVGLGLVILTDWDRSLEAYLVEISPAWLTELTTRF